METRKRTQRAAQRSSFAGHTAEVEVDKRMMEHLSPNIWYRLGRGNGEVDNDVRFTYFLSIIQSHKYRIASPHAENAAGVPLAPRNRRIPSYHNFRAPLESLKGDRSPERKY